MGVCVSFWESLFTFLPQESTDFIGIVSARPENTVQAKIYRVKWCTRWQRYCVWLETSLITLSVSLILFPVIFSPSILNFSFQTICLSSHCLPPSSLFLLRPTGGRHNSRCLVMVLKTCLLHDGRLASPQPLQLCSFLQLWLPLSFSSCTTTTTSTSTSGFWWDSSRAGSNESHYFNMELV